MTAEPPPPRDVRPDEDPAPLPASGPSRTDWKPWVGKAVFEAALIVFSVLLALTLDGWRERAGAALANIDVEIDDTNVTADLGSGFGVLGGVGYDIRVSRRLSITPGVNVWYGKLGDLRALGETFATGWSHNVVDFTIGLTFR